MLLSSGKGCSNCQSRGKRCDESRPVCRRCIRSGIQCTGYSTPGSLGHSVSDPRPKQTRNLARASPTSVASLLNEVDDPVSLTTGVLAPGLRVAIAEMPPYTRPGTNNSYLTTPQASPDNVGLTLSSNTVPLTPISIPWFDNSFIGTSAATIEELEPDPLSGPTGRTSYMQPVISQTPTPPYRPCDLPQPSPVFNPAPGPFKSVKRRRMTSGQASLFDALFSLARPGDEYYQPSASNIEPPRACDQVVRVPPKKDNTRWKFIDENKNNDDFEDTEGIGDIMVKTLTLDRNVESNSLPFILECYALWIIRMLFQPLRIAAAGREYVFRQYARSEVARRSMMQVSIVARIVALSTAYDIENIPALDAFVAHMSSGYMIINSTANPSQNVGALNASDAFNGTYELITGSCKFFPLATLLMAMQAAAPVFRRACPDPPEDLVHLPSLLLLPDYDLRCFSSMDVLLSVLTDRPMFFRYNVDFTAKVTEPMLHIENHLGMHWWNGVPDRLLVTLARMNAIREDFGICTDEKVIAGLEMEIGSFKPVVATSRSSDPVLTVARLVVQESWRQAGYIYLYMGLCGADSRDARVVTAHDKFMRLIEGIKPARQPDAFLIFPIITLGIATLREEERSVIRRRMLNLPDCFRPRTLGNDVIQILDEIWSQTNISGRPAVWSDLRPACLRVTGM